ncbi:SMP-30/gluconolactonase/LRE family protein [uncultured Jannaschia sp.]|uniref:SMP-30/gluconolactonase/LRE family protein n=1 Tax=uncultured Jannaschia sp. TaxID=293347 RepID=UPI002602B78E|nr:SMP-30/gluconolactonase/LRE family protein [uncultured Jannaschia sp.]
MMEEPEVELVVDAQALIGESPVWSPAEGALYWADVSGKVLCRTDHATGATQRWRVPDDLGGYAILPGGDGAIVALRSGIHRLDLRTNEVALLVEPPFDPRTHRFNECGIDPAGRLWLGEMFDPLPGIDAEPTSGPLHSFTLANGLVTHDVKARTANGFAWSADGTAFMLAHTNEDVIERIAFDVDAGTLGHRSVFARVDPQIGQPDGACFDAEGYYWTALHGGGRLHRYAPDGTLDRVIRLPVDDPTMPTFGGPALDVLYVTTACHGRADGDSHAGGLFRLRPGQRGRPTPPFGG